MFSTRDATAALSALADPRALAQLSQLLGFGAPIPIDRRTLARLSLGEDAPRAWVAPREDGLRALLVRVRQGGDAAARTSAYCRAITREAPERCWLVLACFEATSEIVIAAAPPEPREAVPLCVIDPHAPRESDAETLAALVGSREGPDLLVHLRWRETLGRAALTRRFYLELEQQVTTMARHAQGNANADARRTIALLHASRLLFVAFLEARGWLDGDREFLRRHFAERARGGTSAHRRFLDPLWFGTLNTPWRNRAAAARAFGRVPFLNGGLFTRSAIERRHADLRFTDESLDAVIGGLLSRYRLTPRESRDTWSEAAVDPEMLGRAFESLMQGALRRTRGAFYTPPALITQLTREGLAAAFEARGVPAEQLWSLWDGARPTRKAQLRLQQALAGFTVLDPACGSGAFLVYALEELAGLHQRCADALPLGTRRRDVLTRSIFGVDIDPTAVWLCQLRLWLSVVVEEPEDDPLRLPPLPNLDQNIREGDALAGNGFDDAFLPASPGLTAQRLRYTRAVGIRKRTLGQALQRAERERAIAAEVARGARLQGIRRELLLAARAPDLFRARRGVERATQQRLDELRTAIRRSRRNVESLRGGAALPFSFVTYFPDVAAAGGFSLTLGNPPWVRTHGIAAEQRASLRERFAVFRSAAWDAGAADAAAGKGFASQVDLAALFTERAVRLTQREGAIALLLPAKLWGSLAGGGLRALLQMQAPPLLLEEWQDSSAGFDAVVYPSAFVARRQSPSDVPPQLRVVAHRRDLPLPWTMHRERLALDDTPGAPWLLLPPDVRDAFDALGAAGIPLARSPLARPQLGVKCGCNEAFVLDRGDGSVKDVEPHLVRPLLRGEHLAPWRPAASARDAAILWTHDARGKPLSDLPAEAHRRLSRWRRQLEQRSDGRGGPWWALFRTDAARTDRARVVWGDIGRSPRALVLPRGDMTVPLNTCYVVRAPSDDDAHTLAVLLNSSVGTAWLSALAEPARGGYRRFLGWTCARLPIPRDWTRAVRLLAPLGREASEGMVPDVWTMTERVLEAYAVEHSAVAALLSWHQL
ncbi:hypothetical protein Strain138_002551 [Pseudogemmatithrix spongiicola]|uniref:site-specific DNA-methyltransferase (adenine-specific) n=1 Tax=Pseudogemmatithrix spongiicola TaxID=3062599 RepID=A0AA49K1T7_9BACT|nr:hypothetical protein Strain138_002551 [Gemmatimonadaceae bacterium 'strain 138']WKW16141.1 hypothetical protein Strain318_002551 [Gemmatimonadaceae bacterium 'strain 318']